ncbi:DUF4336 domain-containing protein [Novosphingobium sp. RD2P27]|uniref:DUF4336 domain-containing protein n=1 Tax=Novosphingobium kalidii TaxID=3230299 RepID=A0ABV2D1B3_9SPHN
MTGRHTSVRLLAGTAIAAGAAGLSWYLARRPVPDAEEITYPPRDVLKSLAPDLWIVDSGPISAMGLKLPVRMTVIRLRDGSLLLHSPTQYRDELAEELRAIGTVRHLVAPTVAHWTYVAEWQRAFPQAKTWAVPALRDRAQVHKAGVRIDGNLRSVTPVEWAGEIQQGLVTGGGGFQEAWFFHKESETLILADLVQNLEPDKLPPVTAMLMRATVATRATSGVHVRAVLSLNKDEVKSAVRAMIATEPKRVIFAHGAFFTERGAEQLREAFAWLL